jgi:diguanylate cyclase (GGDEF)-like protein
MIDSQHTPNAESTGKQYGPEDVEALIKRCEQAEAALQSYEHRNRILGDSAPFGIMAIALDGRVEKLNRRMRELLPWPSGVDQEGLSIFDFPALVDAGISDDIHWCMQSNRSMVHDYACVDNKGSCMQLRFYVNPVNDGGKAVLGAISFVENYTKVKMAQTAAAESEQRYRLLFQSAPVAMVERDASELKAFLRQLRESGVDDLKAHLKKYPEEIGRCIGLIKTVDCNDAFMELLEAESKTNLLANLPQMVMGPGFRIMAEEIILMLDQGHFPPQRELDIHTLQGRHKRVMVQVMALAGHENTMARIVISMIDISKRVEMEEALRANEQRFREQSLHDNLTGLYNQRYLYHSLPQLLQAANAYRTAVSLVFMDLDNFKGVVDAHGHLNGSRVIQEVAATIKTALVPPCYAVAYAGDEFVIVLPDFDEDQAVHKAMDLQALIKSAVYLRGQGLSIKIQASCGIATFPDHAESAESLLMAADTTLFQIKGTGKGAVGRYGGGERMSLDRHFVGIVASLEGSETEN